MPGEFSLETLAFETPTVIKNITKEYRMGERLALPPPNNPHRC